MSKSDTDCIKYIFNEMDPSEKYLYERELDGDSDLLIEVESLKSINNRLKSIPLFTPPENITESVLAAAGNRDRRGNLFPGVMLIAAVFLLSITIGIFLIENPSATTETAGSQASMNSGLMILHNEENYSQSERPAQVQPWIDRNEVLYFTGNSDISQSAIENSYQRLRPVENERAFHSLQRNLHLTGSNN